MLCGRDVERGEIGALLEAARDSRSGVLVLRGEPGVGKTALLEDARERAADMHILTVRGVESELELPFAGLHQLLRPALHLLDRLPPLQTTALQGALGLVERGEDERFLISAACLTLLSELAERRPVLCLIDDAQWLDTPTSDALLFVSRRLDAEGIVMLYGAREGDDRRFEARELRELELGALDAEAARTIVGRRVDGAVAAAVREALVSQAGGNALALVELPGALSEAQLAGHEPLPETLPLTPGVEQLFLERVRRLPEETQRLLTLVAADDSGSLAPVSRAARLLGIDDEALGPAESAGLVSVRGSRIDLRHPLVRSAIYQGASSTERRAAHFALAEALGGELESDRRAWHRAAAAPGPDEGVADDLESTAERARLRGGHAAAASALVRAAELSTDSESRGRRLVAAATASWHAGQPDRATALLDRASPNVASARDRAEIDHLRGVIEWRCGSLPDACATLLSGAERVALLDPGKALEMLFDAALAGWDCGDYEQLARAGRDAAALPRLEDDARSFLTDILIGVGALSQGATSAGARIDPCVLADAHDFDEPRSLVWAAVGAAVAGETAVETDLLRRAAALARASGAVDTLTLVLEGTTVQGLLAGQYAATAEAAEGLRLAREAGLSNAASLHLASLAWLAAVKGRDDECRSNAAEAGKSATRAGAALANSIAEWAVALLDLSSGRHDEAASRLVALRNAPPGTSHPLYVLASAPDLVEACVRSARLDEAATAFVVLDVFAGGEDAPMWAHALAARCRAMLAAGEAAEAEFTAALLLHTESGRPFDRARTELLFGEHLLRGRRRTESREHLRLALEAFEELGAIHWAERARVELRASGETTRKRDPSTLAELTPQELQVARFVAEGLSNKEVAAQLFLSPRTIDAHLRSVFSKLEITSRTQLARLPLAVSG